MLSLRIMVVTSFMNDHCNQKTFVSKAVIIMKKSFCCEHYLYQQLHVSCILTGDPALAENISASGNVPSSRVGSRVGSSDDDATSTTQFPSIPAAHVSQTSSSTRGLSLLDYPGYMARLLATEELTPLSSTGASSTETSPTIKRNVSHACRYN